MIRRQAGWLAGGRSSLNFIEKPALTPLFPPSLPTFFTAIGLVVAMFLFGAGLE